MTATDDEGDKTSQEVTVTVRAPGVEPPTVEAAASVTTLPAGSSVAFSAQGADPDGPANNLTYSWDFDDGGSSYFQNPTHKYVLPGTYDVKVTVTDGSGATATKTLVITVTDPPGNQDPDFEVGADWNSGTAPMTVQFTIHGGDPDGDTLTFEWDFDDGSPVATTREPKHTFTSQGIYDVMFKVSDGKGGTQTVTKTITVGDPPANQAPAVQVKADPKTGTAPLTVHFSSQAHDPEGSEMLLSGSSVTAARPAAGPFHTYTTPGTYTAKLTATDPGGAERVRDGRRSSSRPRRLRATVVAATRARRSPTPRRRARGSASASRPRPAWRRSASAAFGPGHLHRGHDAARAKLTLSAKLRKQLGLKRARSPQARSSAPAPAPRRSSSSRPRPSSVRSRRPTARSRSSLT